MALQRTRRPRIRSGRSLRSLGSPLNARSLGDNSSRSYRADLFLVLASVVALAACGYRHIADFGEPTDVTRLELRDSSNQLLWRLDNLKSTPLNTLDYGIVPAGYVQVFPATGVPRPLRAGEPLLLVYTTPTRWTRHEGVAVSSAAFKGGGWLSGPLGSTSLEKVFVETRMPISKLLADE